MGRVCLVVELMAMETGTGEHGIINCNEKAHIGSLNTRQDVCGPTAARLVRYAFLLTSPHYTALSRPSHLRE